MAQRGRKALLLCDNAPSHIHDPAKYPNLQIKFFTPNLTAWIQPNDAGIIQSFKAHYKRAYVRETIERDKRGEDKIYKISPLEAMELTYAAWDQVTPITIANCWRHTKICGPEPEHLPTAHSIPTISSSVQESVMALQNSLDLLQAQASAPLTEPMRADEFVRLDSGVLTEQEWTDEEIVQQVRAEEEQAQADLRGELLFDNDEDPANTVTRNQEAISTPNSALTSLNGLQSFLSSLDSSDFQSELSVLSSIREKLTKLGNL